MKPKAKSSTSWNYDQLYIETFFIMANKQNKTEMTRRLFIGASAVGAFGFQVVPSRVFGANE